MNPKYTETVIRHYHNGAQATYVDGQLQYIKYNTGDEAWFCIRDGELVVRAVATHDDLYFEYHRGSC